MNRLLTAKMQFNESMEDYVKRMKSLRLDVTATGEAVKDSYFIFTMINGLQSE